ncbi:MAG: FAD-binding oxidoreductase [Rhodospirillales bacterium]|nr:FAD-binding oxidoreductase [Rhodospirillales bacterium]
MVQDPSVWAASAREEADYPALEHDLDVDIAVIGGGIHGLAAALAAAQAGRTVAVLEAVAVGHGASGRNGGLVVPSLPRIGPDDVLRAFGAERGESFIRLVLGAPGEVFALIRRFGIDCGARQSGWLNPAHAPALVATLERRLDAWQRFGSTATLLSAEETRRRVGSPHFHGALADPSGGHLNPLSYTRGLARAAAGAGARIHERTSVRRLERHGERWRLITQTGSVTAARVLQATNAQSPGLTGDAGAAGTVPLVVYELATPFLSEEQRASILPGGESMSDTRHNLFACCIDESGRLVTGGMAPLTQVGARRWLPPLLARRLGQVFPQLAPARFDIVWSARASLTPDFLPRVFEPAPGWIAPITCNGRGVALSTALGSRLGRWLATGDTSDLPLPRSAPRAIPLHWIAARIPQWLLPLGMLADSRARRRVPTR